MGADVHEAEKKRGLETVTTRGRPLGSGLWICGNCKYFQNTYEGYEEEGTCEAAGVKPSEEPCRWSPRDPSEGFVPAEIGEKFRVLGVDLLDAGEVKLLKYLIACREETLMFEPRPDLQIGQRVHVKVYGNTVRPGTIKAFEDGMVKVVSDGGTDLKVNYGNVQPVAE